MRCDGIFVSFSLSTRLSTAVFVTVTIRILNKLKLVVAYRALITFTIVCDFPLPKIPLIKCTLFYCCEHILII